MPKKQWPSEVIELRPVPVELSTTQQSLLDYYFPKSDWLPSITVIEQTADMSIKRIISLGSCFRCAGLVERSKWYRHINWHTNSLEG